jgi:hypothetical protein
MAAPFFPVGYIDNIYDCTGPVAVLIEIVRVGFPFVVHDKAVRVYAGLKPDFYKEIRRSGIGENSQVGIPVIEIAD